MALQALRRRERRRLAGADGLAVLEWLAPCAGPPSSNVATTIGRLVGSQQLNTVCSVAARCLAQQDADREMETTLGKPCFRDLDDHGYALVPPLSNKACWNGKQKSATKSMESLGSLAAAQREPQREALLFSNRSTEPTKEYQEALSHLIPLSHSRSTDSSDIFIHQRAGGEEMGQGGETSIQLMES